MNREERPAAENVLYLEQGVALLERLDDTRFTASPDGLFRGGVGAQFRHCLDFYACFLDGLEAGRVDYSKRKRDLEVETSRGCAIDTVRTLTRRLLELEARDAERPVAVRSEDPSTSRGTLDWCGSTVGRELQFLVSHTIHHYALIAAVLRLTGEDVRRDFPEFGVAPSTLEHWKEAGLLAPGR
jgi:uncharacterized damage-inducible protein DinB